MFSWAEKQRTAYRDSHGFPTKNARKSWWGLHFWVFFMPPKKQLWRLTNPPLEAADLFLALVPETLDFLNGGGGCVARPPKFRHLQDLSFFPPRRLKASRWGIFYIPVPRVNPGRRKKDATWFCWRWRWKGFTARMSMSLWCYYVITSLFPVPYGFSLLEDACSHSAASFQSSPGWILCMYI